MLIIDQYEVRDNRGEPVVLEEESVSESTCKRRSAASVASAARRGDSGDRDDRGESLTRF